MALEDDGSEDAVPRPSAAFLVSALAQPTVSARIIQERGLLLDALICFEMLLSLESFY